MRLVTVRRRRGSTLAFLLLALLCLVGLTACDSGSRYATPSAGEFDRLLTELQEGSDVIRWNAAKELGSLGDQAAVPALIDALEDSSWNVRGEAAQSLAILHDARAVEPILALIAVEPTEQTVPSDELGDAQAAYEAAVAALGELGDARAAERLVAIAVQPSGSLAVLPARAALAAIGNAAVPAVAAVVAAKDEDAGVRAVDVLGEMEAFDALVAGIGDARSAVRVAAAGELGAFGAPAVEPLLGALKHSDRALRSAAATALGEIGDAKATGPLVTALADAKVFSAATRALVAIHRDDASPLVPYLKAKKTVGVYLALIGIGQADTASALVTALNKFGSKAMGEDYLNCGNATLESAAKAWAKAHGYTIVTSPGGGSETWGGG